MTIQLYNLSSKFGVLKKELTAAIDDLITDGDFILGNAVNEVEDLISRFTGNTYGVGVANGTDALILSLRRLRHRLPNFKTKIITTPLSYLATTSTLLLEGFTPVFCDIDASLNIDHSKLEELIEPDVAAIQLVHYSGIPANLQRIRGIADKHRLFIIEDCAQAFGARYNGEHVGSSSCFSTLSFHPLKLLSCMGDGGMILTNNISDYEWLTKARNHGHLGRNNCEFASINSRLDSIHAKTLILAFDYAVKEVVIRRKQSDTIAQGLHNKHIMFPAYPNTSLPSFNWLVILVEHRNEFLLYARDAGIECKVHYPLLIPQMQFTKSLEIDWTRLQNAIHYSSRIVSVPIGSHVSADELSYMIDTFNSFNP